MVNRTPPQRRDSMVDQPPLSQLHREGRMHEANARSRAQQTSEWEEASQAQHLALEIKKTPILKSM